jgi:hypothetical protein
VRVRTWARVRVPAPARLWVRVRVLAHLYGASCSPARSSLAEFSNLAT